MTTPKLVRVEPREDYALAVTFENGERRVFSLAPYLDLPVFRPLRDPARFREVALQGAWAVEWPGEVDIHRDTLYLEGLPER